MDQIYIVETESDVFLGFIEFISGGVILRNGFAGHPKQIAAEDIVQMYPAYMDENVVMSGDYIKVV